MNLLQLSWKNLINKPLNMLLSLVLFALGVGLIGLLLLLNNQLEEKFENNLADIDLVIGAKGSPLQLILSSMYHIDNPTGNIPLESVKPFLNPKHPIIETAVPLSLGDSHRGYRIVGSTEAFAKIYDLEVAQGKRWDKTLEVTLGAVVADDLGMQVGDTFYSSHGLVQDSNLIHDGGQPFRVVGVFAPSGTVADQLILTNNQSIWAVHDHAAEEADAATAAAFSEEEKDHSDHDHDKDEDSHDHDHDKDEDSHDHDHDKDEDSHDHDDHAHGGDPAQFDRPLTSFEDKDITSLLILFKGRSYQGLNMQRSINENTHMQASTPAIEINRLYELLGVGTDALRVLALVIILVSGLSVFISLFSSLRDRRYELALMRTMGASRGKLFGMIVLEGLLLAAIGYLIGFLLSHFGMQALAANMQDQYQYAFSGWQFLPQEAYLMGGALLIGLLAALLPAIQASNTDIHDTLSEA